jgi:hypothetical protein
MFESSKPFVHADTNNTDDDTLEREARTHLAKSPHLQVVAELVAKLRTSNISWWSATFTRSQWRALPRMQWLAQRADIRQRVTSSLTGLPRKAARSKTPEFQAGLIDAVLDHGDVSGLEFEEAFSPQDLVIYGPAAEIWGQFRQRMPWGDDTEAHQKLVGWLFRILLSEKSTLDVDMLRKPVLTAWVAEHALFASAEPATQAESGAFQVTPVSRATLTSGLPSPPPERARRTECRRSARVDRTR